MSTLNKNRFYLSILSFAAAFLLLPSIAFSAIELNSVTGVWSSATGGSNVSGLHTNVLLWGGNFGDQFKSGYRFDPVVTPIFPVIDTPFDLGTFTHMNKVIPLNTAITATTLQVKISLTIDGQTLNNLTFNYNFNHNETPNFAGTCPAGSVSVCDDIVTITNNGSLSNTFTINGQQYTLLLSGFLRNNALFSSFLTQENMNNSAILRAVITKVGTAVPEPATYLLLCSGLLIGYYIKTKRGARSKV